MSYLLVCLLCACLAGCIYYYKGHHPLWVAIASGIGLLLGPLGLLLAVATAQRLD